LSALSGIGFDLCHSFSVAGPKRMGDDPTDWPLTGWMVMRGRCRIA
jgi:hypothetical protein